MEALPLIRPDDLVQIDAATEQVYEVLDKENGQPVVFTSNDMVPAKSAPLPI